MPETPVEARENDDQLSDEEVASTAILLFAAGFETTTNLSGTGCSRCSPTPTR